MLAQNKVSATSSIIPIDNILNGVRFKRTLHSNLPRKQNDDARFQNVGTLVVKVTHRCNLDCLYCYEHITKGGDMSLETFQSLVNEVLSNTQQNCVMFLFHGGEPTLMSDIWFTEAVSYARSKAEALGKRTKFSVQSNILMMSESKIALFRELGIQLSASLDGPSNLPNAMRQRAEVALRTYNRAKEVGLSAGVLMTINHSNFNHFLEICRWLENEVQVKDFKANVVSSVGRGIELPDLRPEQIFQSYRDILEYMIATNGQGVIEDNLSLEILRFFATSEERSLMPIELCRNKQCGAGERVLGVTPEGKLLPCGRFQWDDEKYFLGSVNDDISCEDVLVAFESAVSQFHNLVPENWYNCSSCEASDICSYGCQAFIVRSKLKANIDCIPTKMRYSYYLQNRDRLLPVYEAIRTRQRKRNPFAIYNYTDHPYADGGGYADKYADKYSDLYKDSYTDSYTDEYSDKV